MTIKMPFEAKLLLLACLALILFGCGSGETDTSSSDQVVINPEEALLSEYPIAYITRDTEVNDQNLLILDSFNPGAAIYVRAAANIDATEINLTDRIFGTGARYDVRDLNISHDGELMVFAARGPFDDTIDPESDEEQPSVWNLYEYSFITGEVYPLMPEDDAEQGHDVTPHYLADKRIIFSSSRQQRTGTIMLDEGKPRYEYQVEVDMDEDNPDPRAGAGYALHVLEFGGANRGDVALIEQVTFNQSHDFDPVLLSNGKVVFSRWDAAGTEPAVGDEEEAAKDKVSFYQMNPDGSELEILFGYRSHTDVVEGQTLQFTNPQISPNSNELIAVLTPYESQGVEDSIVTIDIENFVDVDARVPGSSASGNGIVDIVPLANLLEEGEAEFGGRFSSVSPLFDGTNRAIVSWSFCRLLNENDELVSCNGVTELPDGWSEAPANYGLWLFDYDANTRSPLVLGSGNQAPFYEVAVAQPRSTPVSIPDIQPRLASDADITCDPGFFNQDDGFGIIHIRSVFDLDGEIYEGLVSGEVTTIAELADPTQFSPSDRLARFVRFDKPVYRLDPEVKDVSDIDTQFGPFMREILGYAPIQPDGSVKVKVPADVPLMVTLVDQYGQRLSASTQDHLSWMQVRPGEVMECNGCHDRNSSSPHGRIDARPTSLNRGAGSGTRFPNTNSLAYEADISFAGDGSVTQTCLPNAGETMAEVFVRVDPERINLSPNLEFEDIWTDPAGGVPEASFSLSYSDLFGVYEQGVANGDATLPALPFNKGACLDEWDAFCRIVINYEDHIQPLWDVTRTVNTADGIELMKCVDCHSNDYTDDDGNQLPVAGGLLLIGEIDNDRAESFRDLTGGNDFALIPNPDGGELIPADNVSAQDDDGNIIAELPKRTFMQNGQPTTVRCYDLDGRFITPTQIVNELEDVLVPLMEPVLDPDTGEPLLDDDGNIIMTEARDDDGEIIMVPARDEDGNVIRTEVLDDEGDPIPVSFTIRESALGYAVGINRANVDSDNVGGESTGGNQFREIFQPGFEYSFRQCGETTGETRPIEFDHSQPGLFSDSELKMILEWVGKGSAYYNNPFAVPD